MNQLNSYSKATDSSPATGCKTQAPQILLVEDHPLLQKAHTAFLKELGYNIVVASTGQEALEAINPYLALILMDIGLPDISGLDITKYIRSQAHYQKIPIIALTTYPRDMITKQCDAVGINAIVAKPLPMSELAALVQHWLRQDRARLN